MPTLGTYVWIGGILLQALVLIRAFASGNIRRFPFFYTYVAGALLTAALNYLIFINRPDLYGSIYWACQYATLLLGCGLVLEIFDHVLADYAGARKLARAACITLFLVIFFLGGLHARAGSSFVLERSEVGIERDIRCAQIVLLMGVLSVIFYYLLPLTKGIRGIIYGYALYLFVSLFTLALRFYVGPVFDNIWRIAQPLSYDLALIIWVSALWAPTGDSVRVGNPRGDLEYHELVSLTRGSIEALRAHVDKSVKS